MVPAEAPQYKLTLFSHQAPDTEPSTRGRSHSGDQLKCSPFPSSGAQLGHLGALDQLLSTLLGAEHYATSRVP